MKEQLLILIPEKLIKMTHSWRDTQNTIQALEKRTNLLKLED
jgi:hypothetical protein